MVSQSFRLCLTTEQKFYFMIALVGSFFVVEIVTGYICNSLALVSDAFHMLSDLIAHGVGLAALKISKLKSNRNSFGWGRAEVMGALVNAVFMLAICLTIILESIERFLHVSKVERPMLLLLIGIGGLLINLIALFLFMAGDADSKPKSRRSSPSPKQGTSAEAIPLRTVNDTSPTEKKNKTIKSGQSMNIAAVLRHVIGDAFGSVIVIVVAILVLQVEAEWVFYLDPVLSLCLVCTMSSSTFPLLNAASQVLMQQSPPNYASPEFRSRLTKLIADLDVISYHDFHVWRLTESRLIASIHIVIRDVSDYKCIAAALKQFFHDERIHSLTIQPELAGINDSAHRVSGSCSLPCCSGKEGDSKNYQRPPLLRKMIHAQSKSCLFADQQPLIVNSDYHLCANNISELLNEQTEI